MGFETAVETESHEFKCSGCFCTPFFFSFAVYRRWGFTSFSLGFLKLGYPSLEIVNFAKQGVFESINLSTVKKKLSAKGCVRSMRCAYFGVWIGGPNCDSCLQRWATPRFEHGSHGMTLEHRVFLRIHSVQLYEVSTVGGGKRKTYLFAGLWDIFTNVASSITASKKEWKRSECGKMRKTRL